ncbi:MFS general substrate transporter [Rickenella mellea]|uniref:MFS general substrate transporter n=1 Tax=Rickenella mellea TaxID=50990 RepID=A0A4Y7PYQ7_9AGAM|nr:MFS general substrate transporter [Rickenella mellea]
MSVRSKASSQATPENKALDGLEEQYRVKEQLDDDDRGTPISDFPEGGWAAWATVAGSWIVQFTGFGYTNAYGVYQDYYVREYLNRQTSSQISWIGSTQVFVMMSSGIITGRLFDRGYFYHLIIGGSLLLVFSLFMLSLTKPHQFYQVFLAHGLGVGLGSGLTYIPSIAVVFHHFQRRRALAVGIVASGSSIGGLVHPIMLNNLFHGNAGFANGVRTSAGMTLGLLIIAGALMRTRLPPKPTDALLPALRKFSKDIPYVSAVLGTTFIATGLFFPIFYLQLDAIKHSLDPKFAFYSLSIMNGASVVGRIVPGFFAHSLGVMNMIFVCTSCCGILIFAMLGVKSVASVAVFAMLYGFVTGAYVTLLAPLLSVLSDDVSEIGARMGISFTFTGIGSLIGTPITGAFLTTGFIWWRPIVFSGIVTLAGAVGFAISRVTLGKKRGIPIIARL